VCAGADGDAAARAVDVHKLRVVLRRHFGNRDGADYCYAARVLQLAKMSLEKRPRSWSRHFSRAWRKPSRTSPARRWRKIYKACVATMELGWNRLRRTTPSARSSPRSPRRRSFLLSRAPHFLRHSHVGRGRLALGRAHVASAITGQQQSFSFAVLHFGDQNITAAVKPYDDANAAEFEAFAARATEQVHGLFSLK